MKLDENFVNTICKVLILSSIRVEFPKYKDKLQITSKLKLLSLSNYL